MIAEQVNLPPEPLLLMEYPPAAPSGAREPLTSGQRNAEDSEPNSPAVARARAGGVCVGEGELQRSARECLGVMEMF